MKVTVSFRNELDTRAAEKTLSNKRLKQDVPHLTIQVHQKFVEVRCGRRNRLVNADGKQSNSFTTCAAGCSAARAAKLLQVQRHNRAKTRGLPRQDNHE